MKNEYGNGMLKTIDQMILFIESEIYTIKNYLHEPNSNSQITADGKKLAYNKVLQKLKMKREIVINKTI